MSRLSIVTRNRAQTTVEELYKDLERRIIASPPGLCPVDMALAFLKVCHAQTCGKCVPCRDWPWTASEPSGKGSGRNSRNGDHRSD